MQWYQYIFLTFKRMSSLNAYRSFDIKSKKGIVFSHAISKKSHRNKSAYTNKTIDINSNLQVHKK